jgi:hypothetical protein
VAKLQRKTKKSIDTDDAFKEHPRHHAFQGVVQSPNLINFFRQHDITKQQLKNPDGGV